MHKIDVNCMIGNWVKQDLESLQESHVEEELDYYKIDKAIAYHAMARSSNPIYGNECLVRFARESKRIIPCIVVSPHYKFASGWSSLEKLIVDEKIRFAKLYPREQGYTLGSRLTYEMFSLAEKLNVHLLIDYSEITLDDREMPEFDQLLLAFPTVKVIVTAFQYRRNMMMYSYYENYPNFYTELSICNNWLAYEQVVERYGSDRLLWGTNTPFNKPGSAITMLAYADISEADKEKIAFGNIENLIHGGA